jgi:hypothetical protein
MEKPSRRNLFDDDSEGDNDDYQPATTATVPSTQAETTQPEEPVAKVMEDVDVE